MLSETRRSWQLRKGSEHFGINGFQMHDELVVAAVAEGAAPLDTL